MKKASDINPRSWVFGTNKPKTAVLMHKWDEIRKNTRHMEEVLLTLMSNPAATPEELALASKIYARVTQQLHDCANTVDEYIYHGRKPKSLHMLSCVAHTTGNEALCECKDWQDQNL